VISLGLGYVLDNQGSKVKASAGQKVAPCCQRVQIGSDIHPVPNSMSNAGSFSTRKAVGERRETLSFIWLQKKRVSSVVPLLASYDFKKCSLTTFSFAVPLHNNKTGANI
jgi:hypothetical protein